MEALVLLAVVVVVCLNLRRAVMRLRAAATNLAKTLIGSFAALAMAGGLLSLDSWTYVAGTVSGLLVIAVVFTWALWCCGAAPPKREVYIGERGGQYVLSPSGRRQYLHRF